LTHEASPLHGYVPMDVLYVVLTAWDGQVGRHAHRPVNELPPVLSHLLLMDDAEVLTYELGVDREDLEELEPQAKDLSADHVDVVDQLVTQLVRVQSARPPVCEREELICSGPELVGSSLQVLLVLGLEVRPLDVVLGHYLVYLPIVVIHEGVLQIVLAG